MSRLLLLFSISALSQIAQSQSPKAEVRNSCIEVTYVYSGFCGGPVLNFHNSCGADAKIYYLLGASSSPYNQFVKAGKDVMTCTTRETVDKHGGYKIYTCPAGTNARDPDTGKMLSGPLPRYECK